MENTKLDNKVPVLFFENTPTEQILSVIRESLRHGDTKAIANTLDCVIAARLDKDKIIGIIDVVEEFYLIRDLHFLCKYLFLLYHKKGDGGMARYYLDECYAEIENNAIYAEALKNYELTPIRNFRENEYFSNDFAKKYTFDGVNKEYSVYSFSNEIGQNMTLLKTPYGSIIFDCGAKRSSDEAITISAGELKAFLTATETSRKDIRAIVISHAHFDHYGSLATLMNCGFDASVIFMNEQTKRLINASSNNAISLDAIRPVEDFFVANDAIRITPFVNGHIVGSEGYLVTFDNINIFYTGDFCLHDQLTVKGLNPTEIKNKPEVKQYGIDCLITESTLGNVRRFLTYGDAVKALSHFTDKLLGLGYKVFLPSFAIGISQETAMVLNKNHSVLLDGLAIKITDVYEKITGLKIYNANTRYSTAEDDDEILHNFDCNNVIIASSGAFSKGGTAHKYVSKFLKSDKNVAIIKTGFISGESYGNTLIDRWRGQNNVVLDISLSAHASYGEIIALIDELNPEAIVAIHGNGLARNRTQTEESVSAAPAADNSDDDNGLSAKEINQTVPTADINVEYERVASAVQDEDLGEILIEDGQIKAKMSNVAIMGAKLKGDFISLQKSQPFLVACRLLLKFLKTKGEYEKIFAYLDSLSDYELFWQYVRDCADNNFLCKVRKASGDKTTVSEFEQAEEAIRQNEINSLRKVKKGQSSEIPEDYQQSDIMIVKLEDGSFYVSEKIHGGEPYYMLLRERSDRSIHYTEYQDARAEAERLRQYYLPRNPDCIIVDYDIADYPQEGYRSKDASVQSDIMIVKLENDDYYVSEKIRGGEPYYKFLMDRSYKSTHFYLYQEAFEEAERLREKIIDKNPDCQIVDIDIRDYPKNSKPPIKIMAKDIIYDDDGNVICGVKANGKLIFEFQEEDKDYEFINIEEYAKALREIYENKGTDDCDFFILGERKAYLLAQNCSIPCMRFEIYKAKEMLMSFASDEQLYECDIKLYEGFVHGLCEAIELQKKFKAQPRHWLIYVLDLYFGKPLGLNGHRGTMPLGDYEIIENGNHEDYLSSLEGNQACVILIGQKVNEDSKAEELGLKENQIFAFSKCKDRKSGNTISLACQIEQAFENLFRLGEGDAYYRIKESWIESLARYEIKDANYKDGKSAEPADKKEENKKV